MTQIFYDYSIRATWKGRTETPAAIGVKFLKTLDTLSGIRHRHNDREQCRPRRVGGTGAASRLHAVQRRSSPHQAVVPSLRNDAWFALLHAEATAAPRPKCGGFSFAQLTSRDSGADNNL